MHLCLTLLIPLLWPVLWRFWQVYREVQAQAWFPSHMKQVEAKLLPTLKFTNYRLSKNHKAMSSVTLSITILDILALPRKALPPPFPWTPSPPTTHHQVKADLNSTVSQNSKQLQPMQNHTACDSIWVAEQIWINRLQNSTEQSATSGMV